MIKLLLLLAILAVAYLLWRQARIERGGPPPEARRNAPQEMIACATCGVHLPRGDAVSGADGKLYCSQEHRLRAGA